MNAASLANNRRQHPRVPLDLLVQVRVDSVEQFRAVHASNISVGGLFLRTHDVRPLGSELYFQFTLQGAGALIEGLGKVVHVAMPPNTAGMGIEFVSVLEPSRSIIDALVAERFNAGKVLP